MAARKLLFFVIETAFFVSHRLPLGRAAVADGFEVVLVADGRRNREQVEAAGIRHLELAFNRRSLNPFAMVPALFRLWRVYRTERPDVVHHVALKPVLLGGVVARLSGIKHIVASVTGLGFLYAEKGRLPWVRRIVEFLLPRLMDTAVVQNADDADFLKRIGMPANRVVLIPSAGVDLTVFRPSDEPAGPHVVIVPARLLWDKGIGEFVEAARILQQNGIAARFVLVGGTDSGNRATIPAATIEGWVAEGVIESAGHCADMPAMYASAHVVVLPSYREGFPKALLEAAACGRAVITTDAVGCRDAVEDGVTGLIVPVRDAPALAAAIERLLLDTELRRRMGLAGRQRVEQKFSTDTINPRFLELYRNP